MGEYIVLSKQEYEELLAVLERAEQMAEELRKMSLEIRMMKFRIYNKSKNNET